MARTVQIRIYDVKPERLDEWIEKFHSRIVPLRRELGFEIQGSWVDRPTHKHVWVIAYEGEMSFDEANAAYWASPKRAKADVEPDEFLNSTEELTVEPVLDTRM